MSQAIEEIRQDNLTTEILPLFPHQGEWTEADYFSLPETNKIIELSEGRLVISPSPNDRHQEILLSLLILFANYVKSHRLGIVRCSPLDVRLYEGVIREPDIIFMANEHLDRITDKWGVPDLVMEILSEGTAKVDRGKKYRQYQKAGVLEYWIVDPFTQNIEIFTLSNKSYKLFGKWGPGEIAKSKLLDGFEVSIDEIMI